MSVEIKAERTRAVRPEILAAKLAGIRNLNDGTTHQARQIEEQPRIVEALCFLEWASRQPGGLAKLTDDLLALFPERVGTKAMRELGRRKYSLVDCLRVFGEMPENIRSEFESRAGVSHNYSHSLWSDAPAEEIHREERENTAALEKYLCTHNEKAFHKRCAEQVLWSLPADLAALCDQPDVNFAGPWYYHELIPALFEFMDAHAQRVGARLAKTVVAEKVFDALDYAHSERVMVRVEGDSRFGKTEAVQAWADMWPGRARVIRVPSSNSERDLHKAFAEALGIEHALAASGESIREKVEYVLRNLPLMMICDEAAFLIAQNYSRTTAPVRLNWIRTSIVDRKIPLALIVTPQGYTGALGRFVRKTGYSVEQFIGREALIVTLPNELPWEDLLAVARIHFPGTDEDLLALVAAKAQQSESYLKAVENIARRARYLAAKRGAKTIQIQDIDRAASEALPARALAAAPVEAPAKPKPRAGRSRSAAASVLQAPFRAAANDFPAREVTPLHASPEGAGALATG